MEVGLSQSPLLNTRGDREPAFNLLLACEGIVVVKR